MGFNTKNNVDEQSKTISTDKQVSNVYYKVSVLSEQAVTEGSTVRFTVL